MGTGLTYLGQASAYAQQKDKLGWKTETPNPASQAVTLCKDLRSTDSYIDG